MSVVSDLSKLGSLSPRRLLHGLYDEFANWYVLGPLSWVVLPSRCPPTGGFAPLAHRHVTVKIRGGDRAECRINEFFSFVEVFVLREYEVPGVTWAEMRTIVDVGANVGAATLWFARRAPQATIVAVEPASRVASVLARNVRANGLEERVRVVAAALTDRTGSVELDQRGSSVFGRIAHGNSGGGERVSALSLEDLLDRCGLPEVDLLKLDCEGAEFDILLSCSEETLRRVHVILGEYHSADGTELQRLLGHLEEAGYECRSAGNDSLGLFSAMRR